MFFILIHQSIANKLIAIKLNNFKKKLSAEEKKEIRTDF